MDHTFFFSRIARINRTRERWVGEFVSPKKRTNNRDEPMCTCAASMRPRLCVRVCVCVCVCSFLGMVEEGGGRGEVGEKKEEHKKRRNEWDRSGRKGAYQRAFLVASIHVSSVTRVMSVGNTRFLESNGALPFSLSAAALLLPSPPSIYLSSFSLFPFSRSARQTSPCYLLWPVRAYVHGK